MAVLFCLLNSLTKNLENSISIDNGIIKSIIISTILGSAIYVVASQKVKLLLVDSFSNLIKSKNCIFLFSKNDICNFFSVSVILFIAWIPVLLAYWPGIFSYDVYTQIAQKVTGYNTLWPVVHTLYLQFFYYNVGGLLGSRSLGIAMASIIQMLIFSMQISWCYLFLVRYQVSRKVRLGILSFLAICPIVSVLAISMTKDILFAGFFSMLFVCLSYYQLDYDTCTHKIEINTITFVSVIGSIMFRANGLYAVAGVILVIGIISLIRHKIAYKRLFILLLLAIISCELLTGIMYKDLDVSKASLNEALAVPYMQMAHAFATHGSELSQEELEDEVRFIPMITAYNYHNGDSIKWTGQAETDLSGFVRVYIKMGLRYPKDYVEAFIQVNAPLLYIFDKSNAQVYGYGLDNRQGFLLTDTKEGLDVVHESKLTWLENVYENLFSANKYQDYIVLFLICSCSLYFWTIIQCFFWMLEFKKSMLAFSCVLILGMTSMLAPLIVIRHVLPYILCIPALFVLTFHTDHKDPRISVKRREII